LLCLRAHLCRARLEWVAFRLTRTALTDQIAYVHRRVFADNDVLAARTQGVPGLDDHTFGVAGLTHHIESAHDSVAVEKAVVEFVLRNDVMIQPVEILVGEKLAGKETGSAKTLQTSTSRTNWQGFPW